MKRPLFAVVVGLLYPLSGIHAQFDLRVVVQDAQVSTTCGDIFSAPDVFWEVNIQNQGWVTYPQNGACFSALPDVRIDTSFGCFNELPPEIEVCFRVFENDPNPFVTCDINPDCSEEICQTIPLDPLLPALRTLSLPPGGASEGTLELLVEFSGFPSGVNDLICNAIPFGTLSMGDTLGDASQGTFNNFCATNTGEPNPSAWGTFWVNNIGVWFTFRTDDQPSTQIEIIATSDPENVGDEVRLQLAVFESDNDACDGTLDLVAANYVFPSFDEFLILDCPKPNTTYFLLVDGSVDDPGTVDGWFGLEIRDVGSRPAADLVCDALPLGTVPDGGAVAQTEPLSNTCADNLDDPPNTGLISQHSVWFTFWPPASGHVLVEAVSHPSDPLSLELSVFAATDSTCTGPFERKGSATQLFQSVQQLELSCLDPTLPHYILVDGGSFDRRGNFTLSVSDLGDDTPVVSQDVTLCSGQSLTVGANTYDQPGIYTDTLFLPDGCDSVVITTLSVLPPLTLTLDTLALGIGPGNADGSMLAGATGGAGGYSFNWSSGAGGPIGSGLLGGETYCVTVTDANLCNADTCFAMPFLTIFDSFIQGDSLLCNGDSDGTLRFSASNGTPPYAYIWQNQDGTLGDSGTIPSDGVTVLVDLLPAGTYFVTLSDANFDTVLSALITEPPPITATPLSILDASCHSACDGALSIEAQGGTPPLQLQWENGPLGNSWTDLCAGNYLLRVSDANGCEEVFTFPVGEPPELIADIVLVQEVSCFGGNDGRLEVQTNLPIAQILWSTQDNTPQIGNLPTGSYAVTVTDPTGCTAEASYFLDQPAEPVGVSIAPTASITCPDGTDGALQATVSGPGASFTYQWSNGAASPAIQGLPAGTYGVTVANEKGCSAEASFTLSAPPPIQVEVLSEDLLCDQPQSGSIEVSNTSGGTPPYRYALDGGSLESTGFFPNLEAGTHTLTVEDGNGCTAQLEVALQAPPEVSVELGGVQEVVLGQSLTLQPQLSSPTLQLSWSPPELFDCTDCPSVTLKPAENLTVVLLATDPATGCSATDSLQIVLLKPRRLFAPNVFSPDGDGINDRFTLFAGPEVARVRQFQVFDRQGNQVFRAENFLPSDPTTGWDGRFQGKDMDAAVFVWFAEVEFLDGVVEIFKGDVLLLR